MYRFFCPYKNIARDKIIITDKQQGRHIRDVLRLKAGDAVVIFDDKSNEYDCRIIRILPTVVLSIQKRHLALKGQRGLYLAVACAIPKKSKMDDIVDKLTQLGVDRIIPLETERVIIRLDKHKKMLRQKRWEKIAVSASEQSQRKSVPIIGDIQDLKTALAGSVDFDLKLIAALTSDFRPLKEVLGRSRPKDILIFIGPEGDFSPAEVALARQAGCIPVSLGELVLRVETAALAAASFIRLYEET
ncbi:MAG: 16S rRNA (uracil(1498)-N(3))-methyltransferase [Candidatus Omnitrophica bacterium]|nr:16S rRNA (uracil(1498)-N(3))-methyltransferase [Candidatus Omnitrophota bacterium]